METPKGQSALDMKRARLDKTIRIIGTLGPVPMAKAVATLEYDLGVSEKVAQRYLNTLKELGTLEFKDGNVCLVKAAAPQAANPEGVSHDRTSG